MRMVHDHVRRPEAASIENWVLEILREEGTQSLDSLTARARWDAACTLLAIDRLSRSGVVCLSRLERDDYVVALNRS
jgi:hypothetical protein